MGLDLHIKCDVEDELRWDLEIARGAASALNSQLPYSCEKIKVIVKSGWITLEGAVEWNYARERAQSAVTRVRGVMGVTNSIVLKTAVAPHEIRRKIEDALRRSADNRVTVVA